MFRYPEYVPPRDTGISVLGDLAWGTHMCVFYETKNDLLEINSAYIKAGLLRNEFCVWAVSTPATVAEAEVYLHNNFGEFAQYRATGQLQILPGHALRILGDGSDAGEIKEEWRGKLHSALSHGFVGMRVSLNAMWLQEHRWQEFSKYERELDLRVAGQKLIVMCAYPLGASRATDLMEGIRAHNFTAAMQDGKWDLLRNAAMMSAQEEIERLRDGTHIHSRSFPGHELLTPQEWVVLAQVVRGASSKKAGRTLGLSPRTVEFHRRNIMRKLGAANIADLLVTILANPVRT